jgi:hypothetical protein
MTQVLEKIEKFKRCIKKREEQYETYVNMEKHITTLDEIEYQIKRDDELIEQAKKDIDYFYKKIEEKEMNIIVFEADKTVFEKMKSRFSNKEEKFIFFGKEKGESLELKETMKKWIEKKRKEGIIVKAALENTKFCYNGNYNQVKVKKGDIIEVTFELDNDGMDFVYYNILNE